jgi:phage terminase small subunit
MGAAKLTAKQSKFVSEYLIDLNATQAAIRAGYSEKTAYSIGEENLRKPEIAKSIQEAMTKREKRIEITQDMVLADIEAIKRHAMKEGFDAQGNKVMNNYPAALKASELQCKHLGILVDKTEVTGKDGKDLIPPSRVLNISKDTTSAQIKAMAQALNVIGDGEYDTEI